MKRQGNEAGLASAIGALAPSVDLYEKTRRLYISVYRHSRRTLIRTDSRYEPYESRTSALADVLLLFSMLVSRKAGCLVQAQGIASERCEQSLFDQSVNALSLNRFNSMPFFES